MANKKIINIGNQSNDGTGDTIRDAFDKVNSNFDDLYNVAGLGDGLRFIKLREAPSVLESNTLLTINTSATKIVQRTLVASTGVQITLTDDSIIIANTASNLKSDANPILGGDLDGLFSHKGIKFAEPTNDYDTVTKKWVYDNFLNRDGIYEKDDTVPPAYFGNPVQTPEGSTLRGNVIATQAPTKDGHVVNKGYADSKVSLDGAYTVDPATGNINPALGTMTGPLVLFRDPITQDDVDFEGQIAATKRYVDNSSFVSAVNFYVSTTGRDNRTDIPAFKKGRALAYAFKTIGKAAEAAEQMLNIAETVLGPYQKVITTNNGLSDVTVSNIQTSPYVTDATRVSVVWAGGEGKGTDAFANGSLFPGCYIVGQSTGAIGRVEKIGYTTAPNVENYDIVLVDYADTLVSDLTPLQSGSNVVLQFNTANLVNVPDFWKGYIFKVDDSVGGGEGTIVDISYYTDPVTQNVYDRITVNFTTPLGNMNVINGQHWHVYSGYFQLGERLKWGQKQDKTQITIIVESGEHMEQYPIRLSRNCSIRGDEFRRSIPKPATFVNSELPTISVSPWANLYFRRDTQVDGIIVSQLDTDIDYVAEYNGVLTAIPSGTENDSITGVVTFTVSATQNGTPVAYTVPSSWKGKVFVGHGGQGEILSVTADTFSVNLAQNDSYLRKLTTSVAQITGQWHVYTPVNHGYHYLRDAKRPVNYVIKNQVGNYLTSARLLTLNRGYIQAEVMAYLDYLIANATVGSIWYNFTFDHDKCKRDVGTIIDAICADLDAGNISNSLTAADAYRYVSVVQSLQLEQTTTTINKIGELAQRIVQNIPTGEGQGINSYQSTQLQSFDTAYQSDMAVVIPVIGYSLDPNNIDIIDPGLGYQFPPTIAFEGGNFSRKAVATASIDNDGAITGLVFSDTGEGYTEAPTVLIIRNGAIPSVPASIEIPLAPTGKIKSVNLLQPGRGYYSTPDVKVVGNPGASGAVVSVTTGTVGPNAVVTSVTLVSAGSGYSEAYVQLSGGTFNYNATKCERDVGLIVDAIAQDVKFGGTSQSTFAGIQYWNHNGYVGSIAGELTTTTNAINYAKEIAKKIVVADTTGVSGINGGSRFNGAQPITSPSAGVVGSPTQATTVGNLFATIANILNNGVVGITDDIVPNGINASANTSVIGSYNLLQANRTYIVNEVVAYVNATKSVGFVFDQTTCERDVGYMVDSVCNDLLYGGNRQSIQSGVYYFGYNDISTALPGEQAQSVAAYNYIKTILPSIIAGVEIVPYQTGVSQNISLTPGDSTAWQAAQAKVEVIKTIIIDGPNGITKTPLPVTANGGVGGANAAAILIANKEFIQAEVIAYISAELSGGNIDNSLTAVAHLTEGISSIVGGNPDFNPPLYNDDMDVFLMNDATMLRYISGQGHGGFMKVLDPEGQILAKSPYTQTASSFSRSKNRHVFSGGIFVDGFAGNLQMTPRNNSAGKLEAEADLETGTLTKIFVQGLKRKPQTPTFFLNNGISYEVDFVSEFQLDATGQTYQGVLNLNPARPGGFSRGRITASGFQPNKILPVSISSPTVPGGVKARGTIETDGSGELINTDIDFSNNGVGYVSTDVTVVLGGAVIDFPLNDEGGINTSAITIVNSGTGYVSGLTVNFAPSGGTGGATAQATVVAAAGLGGITGFNWSNVGSGYSTSPDYWFGTDWDQTFQITNGYIGTLPSVIETITAGNRSMLANDYTQMNDLGYGIFVTNGGFMENVSMFTYYCQTSYYALNGAQVRTITGSSAYGNYGLVAEGSDPLETPIQLKTLSDTHQIIKFQNATGYTNVAGSSIVYAVVNSYEPYGKSEVEVNHNGVHKNYTIVSATKLQSGSGVPDNYYLLSLDTNGEKWYSTMADGTYLDGTYRIKYQQKYSGLNPSILTRTATVINFEEDPQTTYKVSSFSYQGNDITLASTNNAYNYISIQPWVESTYRQGVYNVVKTSGTGYTPGQVVTVTFRTPTTITANAQYGFASLTESTASVAITSASGPIHVGMLINSADGNIVNNPVTWVNTSTSSPTIIGLTTPVKTITLNTALTITGTAAVAKGTADSNGIIQSVTVTESGVGYSSNDAGTNGPLPVASVSSGNLGITSAKIAGLAGGTVIKVNRLKALDAARIKAGLAAATPYYYMFGFEGFLFKITDYKSPEDTDQQWAELTVQRIDQQGNSITPNGIPLEMMSNNIFAGNMRNQDAAITVKISTLRATSHDMVDIGTGGYAASKIPNDLFGPPLNSPAGNQEVIELRKGRVFFVTTDQDGTFSVGGYLIVDQAKGQVSLNAPVALANLPSIKLQKGQLIDDFSADSALTGESNNTVPTERAIVQFVERRLGTSRSGAGTTLNLIGPGYIDRAGVQGMKNRLDMGGFAIQNVSNPGNLTSDAATKYYSDLRLHLDGTNAAWLPDAGPGNLTGAHPDWGKMRGPLWAHADPVAGDPALQVTTKRYVDQVRQLSTLSDVVLSTPADQDFLMFSGATYSVSTTTSQPIWNATRQVVNVRNSLTNALNTPASKEGGSDVEFERVDNWIKIKLRGAGASGTFGGSSDQFNPITDYHVNSSAQIRQYKLLMTRASTTATVPVGSQQAIQAHLGVSAYDSTMFTTNDGWVSLLTSTANTDGIALNKLQRPADNTEASGNKGGIVGSVLAGSANATYLSSGTVVTYLEALTKDGRMTLTGSLLPAADATNAAGVNLGSTNRMYKNVYADTFTGTATKAISLLSSIAAHTYVQASTATSNTSIVQRDATGFINGKFVVDNGGSVFPSENEVSDLGLSAKRFNNAYIKTLSAGASFSGNLFGSWTLTGINGTSRPELLGADNGTAANGANIGRDNAVGRINMVYSRGAKFDDARMLGMTVTNTLNAGYAVVTNTITAGSISFTNGALPIAQGGTNAGNEVDALSNLIVGAIGAGANNQVLTSNGLGGFRWGVGGGGGGSAPTGTRVDSGRKYFDATAGQTVFTGVPTFIKGSNQLRVYINGVRQNLNDYVENNNGTEFTLNEACVVGDQILAEVDAYVDYQITAAATSFDVGGTIPVGYTNLQDAVTYIEGDKMRKSGGTFTGDVTFGSGKQLNLPASTLTKYALKFGAGTLLTTPVAGAVEWDGSLLYVTQTSGPNRKTLAFQDWVTSYGFAETSGSYADPSWITSLSASKVGLGNVTNESKATMFTSAALTGTPTAPTPTSGSSNTQIATKEYADNIKTFAVPQGGIIMWSGAIAEIPAGWALCDGSNSTPDLRDKFVMGAGNSYAVAATGGSADASVVSHGHTITDPGHTHNTLWTWYDGGAGSGYTDPVNPGSGAYAVPTTSSTTGITVNSAGTSGTNANLPPYYALAYIMKT